MADSRLMQQLLGLLSRPQPLLVATVLCVLDALSSEPICLKLLLKAGWCDAVPALLQNEDLLVRRWAERALCSLYMASAEP